MKTLSIAALCVAAPLLLVQEPDPQPMLPEVGSKAPAFRLNDQDGEVHAVGGEHAQWTVLAFYPKALTGG